jgi:hypothetical protein
MASIRLRSGPTKGMDASPAPPLVARHVERANDGGSEGMASPRPMIKFGEHERDGLPN